MVWGKCPVGPGVTSFTARFRPPSSGGRRVARGQVEGEGSGKREGTCVNWGTKKAKKLKEG